MEVLLIFNFRLFKTPAQNQYKKLRSNMYRNTNVFIVVFEIFQMDGPNVVSHSYDHVFDDWFQEIKPYINNTKVFSVAIVTLNLFFVEDYSSWDKT